MAIKKVIIKNFKSLKDFNLELNPDINIVVGNNESGKSTLLEAINLAMTGQINGRSALYEMSPYLMTKSTVDKYIEQLKIGERPLPPRILIEIYLELNSETAKLRGNNNCLREDSAGVSYTIEFNEEYYEEYSSYIEDSDEIRTVPIEYYEINWFSFDGNAVKLRSMPIKTTILDTSSVRLYNGTDYYIQKVIEENLDPKEKVSLAILYRKLKETFADEESIKSINKKLKENKDIIADKDLTVSIDISKKTSWETNLISYISDIPFHYIGKGDQNFLKMMFALERHRAQESQIILIEEPENHLAFSTMNKLISMILDKIEDKQLIITTHNAFILNKLGLDKLILISESKSIAMLQDLSNDTQDYFKKLPGYDTLRLVLSEKSILTEGPSDELIVQKAYFQEKQKLPSQDGIDVISVGGLSFKRFLEIAKLLNKNVVVITDNDGNVKALKEKYKDYWDLSNIEIFYDQNECLASLEHQLIANNELSVLNSILGRNDENKEELLSFMNSNKTETALKIFNSTIKINIPEYIKNAIK